MLAAQAAGAHDRAGRQLVEAGVLVGDEGVARVFALEHGGQRKAFRQLHRHVLERMDRQVGAPLEHGRFELLDEQALAADLGQGAVEDLVATGCHSENFDAAVRI
jgi:hypothetical protein